MTTKPFLLRHSRIIALVFGLAAFFGLVGCVGMRWAHLVTYTANNSKAWSALAKRLPYIQAVECRNGIWKVESKDSYEQFSRLHFSMSIVDGQGHKWSVSYEEGGEVKGSLRTYRVPDFLRIWCSSGVEHTKAYADFRQEVEKAIGPELMNMLSVSTQTYPEA